MVNTEVSLAGGPELLGPLGQCQDPPEARCKLSVALLDGVAVDPQGDRRIGVAEPRSDCHSVESGCDCLRRAEVPQGVEVGVDAGLGSDAGRELRHDARTDGLGASGGAREDERVRCDRHAQVFGVLVYRRPVALEDREP